MDYISQDPLHSDFLLGSANGKHRGKTGGRDGREVGVFPPSPFLPHCD